MGGMSNHAEARRYCRSKVKNEIASYTVAYRIKFQLAEIYCIF